ncbi:MAG TPA: NTP transferase domain-containing protein [Tepidisphaeraceae bacterium]|jgi:CMP-N-acetylneuraminic acid synthetase|nr:NTP transferase domain-containing protein [Tepidisphaeraceae bacterium]
MNTLAVIMARAGSLGLKSKHLLPLVGRPVIAYTFDHARSAETLTRTVVSTDCLGVKSLAIRSGFGVIDRPANLATSDASVQDVMLHALRMVESDGEFTADALVVLYGNVPVRGRDVIDRAVRHLQETGCDSVRSFCPVGKWHPNWMSKLHGDKVEALRPGSIHRRQDLEQLYLHDGAVVAVSRDAMLNALQHLNDPHAFFGMDRRAIHTEMGETVEIDHQRDLYMAEAILRDRGPEMLRVAV